MNLPVLIHAERRQWWRVAYVASLRVNRVSSLNREGLSYWLLAPSSMISAIIILGYVIKRIKVSKRAVDRLIIHAVTMPLLESVILVL
jgi:hypothetical protein